MKIALMMENSREQNAIILKELNAVADEKDSRSITSA